jgi:hypothetical protein
MLEIVILLISKFIKKGSIYGRIFSSVDGKKN